jgi:hypothetical protein
LTTIFKTKTLPLILNTAQLKRRLVMARIRRYRLKIELLDMSKNRKEKPPKC